MRDIHHALSRALSFCCESPSFDLERFFHRATWELHHLLESEVAAMAFVIKKGDGSWFVGRSREHQALPAETLLGMLVEQHGERLKCRVRDHALDTVRFLDHRFRASVVVRLDMPDMIAAGSEAALWFGLLGGATPSFMSVAETMGQEVSEWLLWYGAIIEANRRGAAEQSRQAKRLDTLTALLHDARAPLGVLKYIARGGDGAECVSSMRHELEYLEELLAQGAPHHGSESHVDSCDMGEVLRRVYRRYATKDCGVTLTLDIGYRCVYGRFPSLELERIVTNLVSNARRHAPDAQIQISVEERSDTIIIHVKDNGPGMPARTLEALREGSVVSSGLASGWGVGLQSCIARARSLMGDLSIASREGEGTCVSVAIPRGEAPYEARPLEVADGGIQRETRVGRVDVYIIDDDREHGASLGRLLGSFGVETRQSDSLETFLRDFQREPVSSILCDAHMPDGGAERLLPILATCPHPPRLAVVSGDASDDQLYRLAALGAQAFFTKPVDIDEVVAWVRGG